MITIDTPNKQKVKMIAVLIGTVPCQVYTLNNKN